MKRILLQRKYTGKREIKVQGCRRASDRDYHRAVVEDLNVDVDAVDIPD